MDVAALIAWIVTASGGAIIVATWLAKGGAREPQDYAEQRQQARLGQRPTALGLTMHLVIPHGVLALVGLVLWIAFTSDNDAYSEARVIAPVAVVVVAAIGAWCCVAGELPPRRARTLHPRSAICRLGSWPCTASRPSPRWRSSSSRRS
jgi:hypothetical protein